MDKIEFEKREKLISMIQVIWAGICSMLMILFILLSPIIKNSLTGQGVTILKGLFDDNLDHGPFWIGFLGVIAVCIGSSAASYIMNYLIQKEKIRLGLIKIGSTIKNPFTKKEMPIKELKLKTCAILSGIEVFVFVLGIILISIVPNSFSGGNKLISALYELGSAGILVIVFGILELFVTFGFYFYRWYIIKNLKEIKEETIE